MDKKRLEELTPIRNVAGGSRRISAWRVLLLFLTALGVGALWLSSRGITFGVLPVLQRYDAAEDTEAVWNTIPPSTVNSLLWASCYSGQQCARMIVPLDYSEPAGVQAGIALVKVPSKLSPRDKKYRGPILFNPGGPGGSGVDFIKNLGQPLQMLIGDEYDIIGFDPRGVARTTPQVVVFPDKAQDVAWRLRLQEDPLPNATVDAIARLYAKSQVYGAIANVTVQGSAPYVSTALVARDMLNIMHAHGYDKLQYWGLSYGTVLGSTFAAMFPNHVGRMVIDGVVDVAKYYEGSYSNALQDTDKVLRMILEACVEAGPDLCALHESTADKVHTRLTAIYDDLKHNPLPIFSNVTDSDYGLLDYRTARHTLYKLLSSPYGRSERYPSMDFLKALAEVEKGNGLDLARYTRIIPAHSPFKCTCRGDPVPAVMDTPDAMTAIACSDGGPRSDTLEDLEREFSEMSRLSEFAEMWPIGGQCSAWKIRAAERFTGRLVGNTSFPILLIGNTADPVTPLSHARKVSRGFKDSVVLHQDSAGHCSLSAASLCTAKAIRNYFREGRLPEYGTVCGIGSSIFPSAAELKAPEPLVGEDKKLLDAWRALTESFEVSSFGIAL